MKLKIRDLAYKLNMGESKIRTLLARPEFACFIVKERNERNLPIMYFDLTETSKKMLLQHKRGYKPEEKETIEKYINENVFLQKEKQKLLQALNDIEKEIRFAYYSSENFKYLTKQETNKILKIIKDVL